VESATQTIGAENERWQEPGSEEQWSDSLYFGGGDGRGLAFYSRIGRRPNEGTTEGALGVWLPGQGFMLSFAREAVGNEIACGPIRFECIAPLLLWELQIEGSGRLYERAEHLATERERYREVELRGRLLFTAWREPLGFRSGLAEGVARSHYEQPGSVSGVLEVGGRRRALAGSGLRDHSWGTRNWQKVPYWRWFGMVVDPDTFVLVNNVGTEDGGESAGGFLSRDGVVAAITECDTESELDPKLGFQRRFVVDARDELGRGARLEGKALEVAPLRQRRDGRLTHVNEALTEYRWEDWRGIGISEYLLQAPEQREGDGAGN
jgi:hypothetical protein